jgi:hypothetical protein
LKATRYSFRRLEVSEIQLLEERSRAAESKFAVMVRPLLAADGDETLRGVASCVLVRVADRHVLFSAAHVFADHPAGLYLPVIDGGPAVRLGAARLVSVAWQGAVDSIDVAILALDRELATALGEESFLQPGDLETSASAERGVYLTLGYPASRNRRSGNAQQRESWGLIYMAPECAPEMYGRLGLDRSVHVAIPFNKKLAQRREGLGPPPKPAGISGGALIRLRGLGDDGSGAGDFLGGIVHTHEPYPSNVLIGTRISIYLQALRHIWPDLAVYLPPGDDERLRFRDRRRQV